MILIISKSHVYRHGELGHGRIAFGTYTLASLLITGDFALNLKVAITFYLLKTGVIGKLIFELIIEHWAHGSPHIATADGELGYLDGLGLRIVDAGAVELIAYGATCSE